MPSDFLLVENYLAVFQQSKAGTYLWNSVRITVPTVIIAVALSCLTGYALSVIVSQWQLVSAASLMAAIRPVLMFFAMQKHFIAGLTLGAAKG